MSKCLNWFSVIIIACYFCAIISGCTYHTHYEGGPEGTYELKESQPVSKEKVVERHYVVE